MASEGVSDKHVMTTAIADAQWLASPTAMNAALGNITGCTWSPASPTSVTRMIVLVTTAFSYNVQTAEGVVTLFKRVTYGSDTGRIALGTIRLLDNTPIGVRLYKDIGQHMVVPGQQLVMAITTAATGGGGIVGNFLPEIEHLPVPEMPANMRSPAGVTMMVPA